jgi:hypothetical protein
VNATGGCQARQILCLREMQSPQAKHPFVPENKYALAKHFERWQRIADNQKTIGRDPLL